MTEDFVTVLPAAGRLMASLRDIGYDAAGAVADLVDNSVDAGAAHVHITVRADGPDSWVRVADDGLGMSAGRLDEAMRYGSRCTYGERALGHFGLGLKTASLSQCRQLTVASRRTPRARFTIRRWDLDEVLRRDSWDLQTLTQRRAPAPLTDALPPRAGTVVLWEKLDRLLPKRPTAGLTERVLDNVADDIARHLEMVFHRFLSGEAYDGRQRLLIELNGRALEPWDPFARDEPRTQALPPQQLDGGDREAGFSVDVRPYVLPSQQAFSSSEAHRRAAGPNRWNRHQGFYIYRRDRLIQAGGWNRLRTLDEHAKLARIAVDLPLGREDVFAVDVAKMRVVIPEELRPGLRAIASAAVAVAQERYRDHLDEPEPALQIAAAAPSVDAISISRDWPAIMRAVENVVGDDPQLRDALLVAIANVDPDDIPAEVSAHG
jgi:anti-sigma regulatory factor (Ser/Thr protein kinase)